MSPPVMPVISTNVSPQCDWLPHDWLVPATEAGTFPVRTEIQLYTADQVALADKIDQFASDATYYQAQAYRAGRIAEAISWDTLKPKYMEILQS